MFNMTNQTQTDPKKIADQSNIHPEINLEQVPSLERLWFLQPLYQEELISWNFMPLVKDDQGQRLAWFNEIWPFYSKVQFCKNHVLL